MTNTSTSTSKNIRSGKKLWVEITPALYELLQENAQKRNITFTKYINRILIRYSIKEELYENKQVGIEKKVSEQVKNESILIITSHHISL